MDLLNKIILRHNRCLNNKAVYSGGKVHSVRCDHVWLDNPQRHVQRCSECDERGVDMMTLATHLRTNVEADLAATLAAIPLVYLKSVKRVTYSYVCNELRLHGKDGIVADLSLAARERKVESRTLDYIQNYADTRDVLMNK